MQDRLEDFRQRGVEVVAVSVDPPEVTAKWAAARGFTFPLVSDTKLSWIRQLDLENDDVAALAYHAVYIVDGEGRAYYRKLARRRAYPPEWIEAIDFHHGRWEPPTPTPATSTDSRSRSGPATATDPDPSKNASNGTKNQ